MNYAKQGWQAEYSKGVNLRHLDDGGFRFAIPASPGHVNYVLTREFFPLNVDSMTVKVRVNGSADVEFSEDIGENDPGTMPPSFRVLLLRNMGGNGRWWSREGVALAAGLHTLRVDLREGEQWGGVMGNCGATNRAFAKFRLGEARVGLSFGGGNDYGHGIRVAKGKATLRLETFFGK